jgi:hypothetical protein
MLVLPAAAVQTGAFHPNSHELRLIRDSLHYGMPHHDSWCVPSVPTEVENQVKFRIGDNPSDTDSSHLIAVQFALNSEIGFRLSQQTP